MKLRSSYKNGWSPTFVTIRLQRIALLDILGHTLIMKGLKKWQIRHEQDIGIAGIITTLETKVLKVHRKQQAVAHALFNNTLYPSSYWQTLNGNVDTDLGIRLLKLLKLQGYIPSNMVALSKHGR